MNASTLQALRRHLLAHDLHMSTAASLKPVQPGRANRLRVLQPALEACGFNQLNQFFARSPVTTVTHVPRNCPFDAITLQSPETLLIAGDCVAVYDEAGNMIERHEHAGDFKEW